MAQRLNKSPALSRRGLLGATALPAISPIPLASRSLADACQVWLSADRRLRKLLIQWGDVEASLAREIGWYQLSEAERAVHPRKRDLDLIEEELERMDQERNRLLSLIPTLKDSSDLGLRLRLMIVAQLVEPADCPQAHALLRSVLRDLGLRS